LCANKPVRCGAAARASKKPFGARISIFHFDDKRTGGIYYANVDFRATTAQSFPDTSSSRECSRASPDLFSLAANGAVISHFYVCTSFVLSLRPILFRPCTFKSMSYKKTNFASTFPFFSFPPVCYGANVNVYMSHTRRGGGTEKPKFSFNIRESAAGKVEHAENDHHKVIM
jgi:hypothetical protein